MNYRTRKDKVYVKLTSDCIIDLVEEDLKKFVKIIEGKKKEVVLQCEEIENIDTAYIQLMLMFLNESKKNGMKVSFSDQVNPMIEGFKIYGIEKVLEKLN